MLDALDLDIRSGEFLVFLGPSGCGKTTTMRIIAGLERATSGDIVVGGVRVNDLPARERDMAMVFQNYGLYPHMSVAENIAYPLRLRNTAAGERQALVEAIAAKVELTPYLARRPKALSGGQRQRVALARALVRQPNVFLLDEPLSNLDAKLRVTMRTELNRLHHDNGVTTVYVTHDQIEAMTLATRVAVMNAGRIAQLGTPQEIYQNPQDLFVASFVGTPEISKIEGTLRGGAFHGPSIRLGGVGLPDAPAVTLGVRPNAVTLTGAADCPAQGTVYSAEFGGDTTYVTVRVGTALVTVLAPPDRLPAFDEEVGLAIDSADCFFFDTASGTRLAGDRAAAPA